MYFFVKSVMVSHSKGNHEEMCISGQSDPNIKDIHQRNGGEWFYQLPQLKQLEIIEQFNELPLVIEVKLESKNRYCSC